MITRTEQLKDSLPVIELKTCPERALLLTAAYSEEIRTALMQQRGKMTGKDSDLELLLEALDQMRCRPGSLGLNSPSMPRSPKGKRGASSAPYQMPNISLASSEAILYGSQRGFQTNSTFTFSRSG